MNYAELNFLAAPEFFRLAWLTKADSLVQQLSVGAVSTAWHLRPTNLFTVEVVLHPLQ
jgi:hypothetical protein